MAIRAATAIQTSGSCRRETSARSTAASASAAALSLTAPPEPDEPSAGGRNVASGAKISILVSRVGPSLIEAGGGCAGGLGATTVGDSVDALPGTGVPVGVG